MSLRARLNTFSAQFVERLRLAHPEWQAFGRESEFEVGAVEYRVPRPHGGEPPLVICTVGDEVTVEFDRVHKHFGWSDVPDEKAYDEALAFIDDILAERVVIGVVMDADRWVSSFLLEPGEWPEKQPHELSYLRSWLGTYDEQIGPSIEAG
jgi:hypothetical protein